ncbi:MAG: hypothetical protein ABSH34_28285 [Verrucomicrobiota bacterium]|jgi:hypothetical protein
MNTLPFHGNGSATTPKTLKVRSGEVIFTVRLVTAGDRYGRDFCLCYDKGDPLFQADDPLVEFYDARHPTTEFGWFISRYYASTLRERAPRTGLCLQGDAKHLSLDAEAFARVHHWLAQHLGGERLSESARS